VASLALDVAHEIGHRGEGAVVLRRGGHAPAHELSTVAVERDSFDLGAAQVESYAHADLVFRDTII
jgi:hypothetical protein